MENSPYRIYDLPVELLNIIFQYISDYSEKVILAKMHPLLEVAFAHHLEGLTNHEEIWKWMSIDQFDYCMSLCGTKMKNLDIDDRMIDIAAKFCPNLEKLRLDVDDERDFYPGTIVEAINKLQQLKSVEMGKFRSRGWTYVMEALSKLPMLKELTLIEFSFNEVKCLRHFLQLEKLIMMTQDKFTFDNLAAPRSLKNLRLFKLLMPQHIKICHNFPSLESVHISSAKFLDNSTFPYLPKLKFLNIDYTETTIDVMFTQTIHLYNNQMEKLRFLGHSVNEDEARFIGNNFKTLKSLDCTLSNIECIPFIGQLKALESLKLNFTRSITVKQMIELLYQCTNLRHLELYNGFPIHSKDNFVTKLKKTLTDIGVTSAKPMVLIVDTDNYENLMQEVKLVGESPLLTIKKST